MTDGFDEIDKFWDVRLKKVRLWSSTKNGERNGAVGVSSLKR